MNIVIIIAINNITLIDNTSILLLNLVRFSFESYEIRNNIICIIILFNTRRSIELVDVISISQCQCFHRTCQNSRTDLVKLNADGCVSGIVDGNDRIVEEHGKEFH